VKVPTPAPKPDATVPVATRLTPELADRFNQLAKSRYRTTSAELRRLVEAELSRDHDAEAAA
jgi:predicted DNA-binding protein